MEQGAAGGQGWDPGQQVPAPSSPQRPHPLLPFQEDPAKPSPATRNLRRISLGYLFIYF